MKKGVIEIQFNWILILVAGGLIFLFFFGIISWGKNISGSQTSTTLATYLDSIMTGASITKSTINKVEIPFGKIEFTCEGYRVDDNANQRRIINKIVFAPNRVEEGELVLWSQDFSVPFRVTNFLYLSSPGIRYVIVGNPGNEIYDFLIENFPEEFEAEFYTSGEIGTLEDFNNYKVRIIYVGVTPSDDHISEFGRMDAEDVTGIYIPGGDFESVLGIEFHIKKPVGVSPGWDTLNIGNANSFGVASLMGAIFSDNSEDYLCNMQKGFDRLSNIAKVYSGRSNELFVHYQEIVNAACFGIYLDVSGEIDELTELSANAEGFSKISAAVNSLDQTNLDAQRSSCALIY